MITLQDATSSQRRSQIRVFSLNSGSPRKSSSSMFSLWNRFRDIAMSNVRLFYPSGIPVLEDRKGVDLKWFGKVRKNGNQCTYLAHDSHKPPIPFGVEDNVDDSFIMRDRDALISYQVISSQCVTLLENSRKDTLLRIEIGRATAVWNWRSTIIVSRKFTKKRILRLKSSIFVIVRGKRIFDHEKRLLFFLCNRSQDIHRFT